MDKSIFTSLLTMRDEPLFRTTFKLSPDAASALKWLSDEHGIQFKDIMNRIMADRRNLNNLNNQSECLGEVLEELKKSESDAKQRAKRKTLLVSQASMRMLRNVCEEHMIARDALVEQIILSSKSCIEEIVQEMEQRRREALEMMAPWLLEGKEICNRMMEILDPQDPIIELMDRVYALANNAGVAIKGQVRIGEQYDLIASLQPLHNISEFAGGVDA